MSATGEKVRGRERGLGCRATAIATVSARRREIWIGFATVGRSPGGTCLVRDFVLGIQCVFNGFIYFLFLLRGLQSHKEGLDWRGSLCDVH